MLGQGFGMAAGWVRDPAGVLGVSRRSRWTALGFLSQVLYTRLVVGFGSRVGSAFGPGRLDSVWGLGELAWLGWCGAAPSWLLLPSLLISSLPV